MSIFGLIFRENIPIPIKYPAVADEGLWGGEGIIEGLYRSKNRVTKARFTYVTAIISLKSMFRCHIYTWIILVLKLIEYIIIKY